MNEPTSGLSRRFCRTPLGLVHYVDAGPRTGVPILLMHQTPRSIDEFAEIIPLLARTRRVIAVDTPGYGCSDPVPAPPTIEGYAGVMTAVLDELGCERVHAVGHHTGAVIAVELAAGQGERVAGVALSGPVYADERGREALLPYFVQWHVRADGSHVMEKWNKFSGWVSGPALVQRLITDLFRAGETSEHGHFALTSYRMEDRLPLVRCPALLIYGSRDPFSTPGGCAPFREAFRPVREVVLEGGVFLPNEAPEAYAEAVLEFTA